MPRKKKAAAPWFSDLPVLGSLPIEQQAAKLREIGDVEAAATLEAAAAAAPPEAFAGERKLWPFEKKAYEHTAHTFGHLPLAGAVGATDKREIMHISQVAGDKDLIGKRIKVTLNRLRVAEYPGGGLHHVLFDFYAQHQVKGSTENLHFNATYRVQQGERAALMGYPIFIGLTVPADGLAFKCFTVNVKNEDDEKFLSILESDVFRSGLKLASTAQPAIAPLSALAMGLTRSIATRNRNVPVQDFYLGLDFEGTTMGARLAMGDYIAVQIPEALTRVWSWADWLYDPASGEIVSRTDDTKLIPYNYIVFGVSKYVGE